MARKFFASLLKLDDGGFQLAETNEGAREDESGFRVTGHEQNGFLGCAGRGLDLSISQQVIASKHEMIRKKEDCGQVARRVLGDFP